MEGLPVVAVERDWEMEAKRYEGARGSKTCSASQGQRHASEMKNEQAAPEER